MSADFLDLNRRGIMLVLSSPSGAGKSSISRALIDEERDNMFLSVSVTTRARRPSEVDTVHYHFINANRFASMRDGGELLEWAEVHGNHYGTPAAPVEEALAKGRDVLFDIDWQGAKQLTERMPEDVASVFVLPPSMAELKSRLERRAEDDADVIARRVTNARDEIGHWGAYEYVIVNEDLDRSVAAVRSVLVAERQRRKRLLGLADFVARLTGEK
jgi:guanylate kinase